MNKEKIEIKKEFVPINYKKIVKLLGLIWLSGLLFSILVLTVAIFNLAAAILLYSIGIIILYELLLKPFIKELQLGK